MLVLDEADVMLDMGFLEDVEYVMAQLPAERVTALFSATMPEPILALARGYMREPEIIRLSQSAGADRARDRPGLLQVPFHRKFDALCRVLDVKQPERALVFCATKRTVDEVVETLSGARLSGRGPARRHEPAGAGEGAAGVPRPGRPRCWWPPTWRRAGWTSPT